ncbi:hypothetical protein Tco_0625844 [Tanacetum coccineum]|uniref:Uncharacterized protein n=1 Tax=Tanacetum coccineum TaxID=301880 RepID=A0ABQ4WI09_9ASTR
MHTSKDDYLINTLKFVSTKEATQIYGAILPESLTSPEMKETKAYKTYLGFATGATPPKIARKFKKSSPSKKDLNLNLVHVDEEPKSAKKKVPVKKTTRKQTSRVVIRDTPVELSSKRKERKKSLRDFHKTHPSGSGTITKTTPSAAKIKPFGKDEDDINNEQDSRSEGSDQERDSDDDNTEFDNKKGSDPEHETDKNESDSESDQEEKQEEIGDDEKEEEDEFVRTPSNDSDDETKISDKAEGDEDEEMDYTTSQLYDDKTEVPVTSSSHSFDLASKFLNFSDIPHTEAEIVSPMDVHVHHEVPSKQTPTLLTVPVSVITESSPIYSTIIPHLIIRQQSHTIRKEVAKLKKDDPLKTQVTALVDEHLHAILGATRDEFLNYLSASLTARITKQVKIQLPQILPEEMSNFSFCKSYLAAPEHRECCDGLIKSYDLDKTLFSTYDKVYSLKRSRKDKYKDEDPSIGSDREFKKRKTSKDAEPTKGSKAKESQSDSSKGVQSQSKSFGKSIQSEEPEFEVADLDMPQDQEENPGNDDEEPKGKTPQQGPTQSWLMTLTSSADKKSKTFDELMSTLIEFSSYIMNGLKITNLTQETLLGPACRFLKGISTNYDELEYDFEECYKALSEKLDWENLEGVAYDKHALWGISYWRDQHKSFYRYARGLVSIHDVYSTKHIMAVTWVKEGNFPCLRINDIEDMLLLVVKNRLTNLSGDDVFDFAIALRMFTRSIVI